MKFTKADLAAVRNRSFRSWQEIAAGRALGDALHHADVDHRRADLLDEVAEVGQAVAVGRHHRGAGGGLGVGGGDQARGGQRGGDGEGEGGGDEIFAHGRFREMFSADNGQWTPIRALCSPDHIRFHSGGADARDQDRGCAERARIRALAADDAVTSCAGPLGFEFISRGKRP